MEQAIALEGRVSSNLMVELLENLPRRAVPNRAYRNEGDLVFSDRTAEWRLDQPSYSNGAAYADLDRDGDLDLVVNNLMGEAFLYRNNSREIGDAHMLAVRFRGPSGNPRSPIHRRGRRDPAATASLRDGFRRRPWAAAVSIAARRGRAGGRRPGRGRPRGLRVRWKRRRAVACVFSANGRNLPRRGDRLTYSRERRCGRSSDLRCARRRVGGHTTVLMVRQEKAFFPVEEQMILDHLQGRQVIGVYPLVEDEACWFLASS